MIPKPTWRVAVLLLTLVLELGWREELGWTPLWVLIGVLTVDAAVAWIALLSPLRRQPPATPGGGSSNTIQESSPVPLPPDLKERAKAVRDRLRTDRLPPP
jgi:hypothetical protein